MVSFDFEDLRWFVDKPFNLVEIYIYFYTLDGRWRYRRERTFYYNLDPVNYLAWNYFDQRMVALHVHLDFWLGAC